MTDHAKSRLSDDFRTALTQHITHSVAQSIAQCKQRMRQLWLKIANPWQDETRPKHPITHQHRTATAPFHATAPSNATAPFHAAGQPGCVYLIGAGAGDPELLTMKAYRLIQQADVILVDWLVDPAMYSVFPSDAQVQFVGKKCGKHSVPQQDICKMLVDEAQQGKVVVRLKGGDPSIFARLAEETDILQAHHIPFAIVPGVTAASTCAAYSGIPLTHRDCAQSVQLVTAHRKREDLQPNWQQLANSDSTLVFYMGLNRIASIAHNLMQHGKPATLPIAIVDQGGAIATPAESAPAESTPEAQQTVIVSTLLAIQSSAMQHRITHQCQGPALIIVGDVVSYRQQVDLTLLANDAKVEASR